MRFDVYIYPDGKRTHEVTQKDENENCQNIRMFDSGKFEGDEQTGPDCDTVHETTSG
jgi:hypothetical protein